MGKSDQRYCPSRGEHVSIKQGFERCMMDHQCFSDDPCPLSSEFERQVARRVKVIKVQPKGQESVTARNRTE